MGNVTDLSLRVLALIRQIFPGADATRAQEMIREFHWKPQPLIDERIHLDILELSGGKLERVRELVDLAKTDWRDLIMSAEYEMKDGKIVQNERGRIRLAEVDAAKKQQIGDK